MDRKDYWPLMFLEGAPIYWTKDFKEPENSDKVRMSKLNTFLTNKNYKKFKKQVGGCVVSKKHLLKVVKKAKEKGIRIRLLGLVKNMRAFNDRAIIITKPTNRKEQIGLDYVKLHEFLHALLMSNKICVQKIKPSYWKLDEALVEYLMYEDFFRNKNRWTLW